MKLKHLKTINELYSDTYLSARDKTNDPIKKNRFNTAYINKFLEEGGDISDIIHDIIDYDLDISIDLSSDEYVFKNIDDSNRFLIQKCLRYESKHLIPLTKNKSIIETVTSLKCFSMNLTDIKGIENLTNLIYLDCSYNNLTDPKGIENLILLETLDCSNNKITDLKGIENLVNLRYLDCSNNQITSLKGIENLNKLTKLYCSSMNLTSLKGIENLTRLETLDCSNNPLDLPYSGSIKTEQERLKQLYKNINELYSDTYRSARDKTNDPIKKKAFNQAYIYKLLTEPGNIIMTIDICLEIFKNNKYFKNIDLSESKYDFSYISIQDIFNKAVAYGYSNFDKLCKNKSIIDNTYKLKLNNNYTDPIKIAISDISNLTNLQILSLNRCNITSLKGIENLTKLTNLDLSLNNITSVRYLKDMNNIKNLNISYNKITKIDPLYSDESRLFDLDCSNNRITDLTGIIFNYLSILDINKNPIINGIEDIKKLPLSKLIYMGVRLYGKESIHNKIDDLI